VISGESAERIQRLATQVGATAVVVSDHDRELLSIGAASRTVACRSIRKSLLGALYGRHVIDGAIDLDATLADLGIDDRVPPPLTDAERAARVRDLLTCRSGVYHRANHQPRYVALPPRGTHRPGTRFCYSNWDFNALGTILERRIGRSLFDEFADTIAAPSGMRDFDRAEQQYATEPWSEHRTYVFRVSTRDLARFGQLYLRASPPSASPPSGSQHCIPREWVQLSTRAHTSTGSGPDYGYLWWIANGGRLFAGTSVPSGSFAAYGTGGQFLLVIPALSRVVALLADPSRPGGTNRAAHRLKLAELIHHATEGRVALVPGPDPVGRGGGVLASGPY
jgi:CubicO group peptidase (beta-lactamase class C family)